MLEKRLCGGGDGGGGGGASSWIEYIFWKLSFPSARVSILHMEFRWLVTSEKELEFSLSLSLSLNKI